MMKRNANYYAWLHRLICLTYFVKIAFVFYLGYACMVYKSPIPACVAIVLSSVIWYVLNRLSTGYPYSVNDLDWCFGPLCDLLSGVLLCMSALWFAYNGCELLVRIILALTAMVPIAFTVWKAACTVVPRPDYDEGYRAYMKEIEGD